MLLGADDDEGTMLIDGPTLSLAVGCADIEGALDTEGLLLGADDVEGALDTEGLLLGADDDEGTMLIDGP